MAGKLGQHFLINDSAIKKIIAALDLRENDTIVEIGPGTGALTLPLARQCQISNFKCQIIVVEKDKVLAKNLAGKLPHVRVIANDILKILPTLVIDLKLKIKNFKLVGNIPYYITGKLLRILSELAKKPELIVITIQKEVAERLMVQAPKMNLLAAAVQIWAKPEIIGCLKPGDFDPPPKVDSTIVKLTPKAPILDDRKLAEYFKLIKLIFKQPRKTLLNNLSTGLKVSKNEALEILKKAGLNGDERPQNLTINTIIKLLTF